MTPKQLKETATHIGTIDGIQFYEDPDDGDEVGLWAVFGREALHTDWHDLPESNDIYPNVEWFLDTYRS